MSDITAFELAFFSVLKPFLTILTSQSYFKFSSLSLSESDSYLCLLLLLKLLTVSFSSVVIAYYSPSF